MKASPKRVRELMSQGMCRSAARAHARRTVTRTSLLTGQTMQVYADPPEEYYTALEREALANRETHAPDHDTRDRDGCDESPDVPEGPMAEDLQPPTRRAPTVNIVCVKKDGLTITAQADSWENAGNEVRRWVRDQFYVTPTNPLRLVVLSDGIRFRHYEIAFNQRRVVQGDARGAYTFPASWSREVYGMDEAIDAGLE